MSALWTVTILVAILAMANSVAVVALIRQVGLLHLQMGPPVAPMPARGQQPARGPQPGSRLPLDPTLDVLADGHAADLILLGFVRPTCGSCTVALPAFASAASGLSGNDRAFLVTDADDVRTRAHLAEHGVSLPLVSGPHLLSVNGIPTIPYAVVTDGAGTVLAAGAAAGAEQLDALLRGARRATQSAALSTGDA